MQHIGNCPKCGYMINDVDKVCPYCGVELYQSIDNTNTELDKFNWGAFFLTWIWGICNNVYISLLAIPIIFIPHFGKILLIIFAIFLGLGGNRLAWQNKRWKSIEDFNEIQREWAKWGIISAILMILTYLFLTGMFIYFLKNIYLK